MNIFCIANLYVFDIKIENLNIEIISDSIQNFSLEEIEGRLNAINNLTEKIETTSGIIYGKDYYQRIREKYFEEISKFSNKS